MKLLIALCLVAVVVAAPPPLYPVKYPTQSGEVQITKYENDNLGLGRYRYSFEQTDGTKAEQNGEIINEGREDEGQAVKGYFEWIGPDNVLYKVTYTADTEGYKPEIEQGPGGGVPPGVVASLLG